MRINNLRVFFSYENLVVQCYCLCTVIKVNLINCILNCTLILYIRFLFTDDILSYNRIRLSA